MKIHRAASIGKLVTLLKHMGVLFALVVVCGGCGMPKNMSLGGYDHQDMSKSRYRDIMLEQAETLAGTTNPEDWRTAAKYYGAIGMLDEMDRCIYKYIQKEPELGRDLIYVGDQIHQFYEGKKR
jgi:hypothetical protein